MIDGETFPVEPWQLRETRLDLKLLAQSESLFALSNGHIGLRGNLDEGEPYGLPGTYLNSFYETRPLPYAEAGFGYPEDGQSLVDVTNGKIIRLLVDDEPFDVRYGELIEHERVLDLRAGTLRRTLRWRSPAGRLVDVELDPAGVVRPPQRRGDRVRRRGRRRIHPRHGAVRARRQRGPAAAERTRGSPPCWPRSWRPVHHEHSERGALLMHRTRRSDLMMAAAMDHVIEVPGRVAVETDAGEDWARTTVICGLRPGQKLRVVKYLAYGWSSLRSRPALRDQVAAALTAARYTGWDGPARRPARVPRRLLGRRRRRGRGRPRHPAGGAVRALPRAAGQRARRAPRHRRQGTDRHRLRRPRLLGHRGIRAAGADLHRAARRRRRPALARLDAGPGQGAGGELDLAGAAFPWRTIRGQECSAYWPAGTAAWHVNADIAMAFERYRVVTGDHASRRSAVCAVLVETARLWMSLGHHDRHGVWHLDGVTGPDEYTAVVRDNVFTNLMAAHNLRCRRSRRASAIPTAADDLGVDHRGDGPAWRDAADARCTSRTTRSSACTSSATGFTTLREWDFHRQHGVPAAAARALRAAVPGAGDQAGRPGARDALQGHAFTPEQKARNVDYYERRTMRDSSLSACTQAVMCAEVGHLELAHDYAYEAALIDLRDLHHNTRDGLHMASLAGAWTALVPASAACATTRACWPSTPRCPSGITRLCFRLRWRDFRLTVDVNHDDVTYTLRDGPDAVLELQHAGETLRGGYRRTRHGRAAAAAPAAADPRAAARTLPGQPGAGSADRRLAGRRSPSGCWCRPRARMSPWPSSDSTPRTPSGTVVVTVSAPSASSQATSTRPCAVSRPARHQVRPPPGPGRDPDRARSRAPAARGRPTVRCIQSATAPSA